MARRAAFTIMVCALVTLFGATGFAQDSAAVKKTLTKSKTSSTKTENKKKLKKKKTAAKKTTQPKKTIFTTPATKLNPTTTGTPGTVKYYFFPTDSGSWWKLRTVQLFVDQNNKIAHADTLFSESLVIDNKRFSLQHLPIMVTSDTSYRANGEGVRTESSYYVDDSIAMTIFNNSVTSGENRIFLVAPVKLRNAWHEKLEDTTVTAIAGFVDSVVTPIGTFDSVLVTLTQLEYVDMRKFYVPGRGIVKTVFRRVGPNGKGLLIITTEMIAFRKPGEK